MKTIGSTLLSSLFLMMMCVACSQVATIESDPRSDASQTTEFSTAPKDDNCCLKFAAGGQCLQERSAGCSRKENLNIPSKSSLNDPCCVSRKGDGTCVAEPLADCKRKK